MPKRDNRKLYIKFKINNTNFLFRKNKTIIELEPFNYGYHKCRKVIKFEKKHVRKEFRGKSGK